MPLKRSKELTQTRLFLTRTTDIIGKVPLIKHVLTVVHVRCNVDSTALSVSGEAMEIHCTLNCQWRKSHTSNDCAIVVNTHLSVGQRHFVKPNRVLKRWFSWIGIGKSVNQRGNISPAPIFLSQRLQDRRGILVWSWSLVQTSSARLSKCRSIPNQTLLCPVLVDRADKHS